MKIEKRQAFLQPSMLKGRCRLTSCWLHQDVRLARRCRAVRYRVSAIMETPFVPAIVTPFEQNSLRLDESNFKTYLKFLWESGYRDIVVNGSTGEFASLTLEERENVAEVARGSWPGRQFVNISSCNVQDSLRLLHHSQQVKDHLKGDRCIADGVLILPPYYYAASTSKGLYNFFAAIIKEAKVPVYLYNFPANVGGLISADLFSALVKDFPQLKGIKNTFDDLPLSKSFKEKVPQAQVLVGHDPSVLASLEAGLDGAIAASASAMPAALLGIAAAHKAGDTSTAQKHLARLNKWNDAVAEKGINPFSAAKAGLNYLIPGFPIDVRPPLTPVTDEELTFLQGLLKEEA